VNCWVSPFAMEGFAGVTAMETSVGAVTVRVAGGLVIDAEVAVICVVPVAAAEARPELEMEATVEAEEFQLAELVTSAVLLSLNVPVAVNCWVSPLAMEGFAGVTAMETNVAAVTVSASGGLVMALEAAVMLVEPAASVEARPELLIAATAVFEEAQAAVLVRLAVLPSV